MTSFITRIFRKKSEQQTKPADQERISGTTHTADTLTQLSPEESATPSPIDKTALEIPQFTVGVGQSVGIQRDHNEDSLFTLTTNLLSGEESLNFGLYIIADGMGGHENGELASSLAVEQLASYVINSLYLPFISKNTNNMDFSIQEMMETGVVQAHQKIKKIALGGGTTLTAALILGDQMTIAHVGDSRAYLIDPQDQLHLLTHDHSLVKRLEEIGQISADQVSSHPQRNVLYRAVGQGEPFPPDIGTFQLPRGSSLLLCTDGLWGVIPDDQLVHVIHTSPAPQYACQSLIQSANLAGGPDNISVIIVHIPE